MDMKWGKMGKLAFLALSVLMVSCLDHKFDNKEEIVPPETGGSTTGIPDDFDYSTTDTHRLIVKVRDEYEGKYYYTVDIYDANPVINTSAGLMVRAKTNSKMPFEFDIVVPKGQESVFVRVKDPQGYKFVTELKIAPGNLLLDFNAPASETKAFSSLRSNSIDQGEVDYQSFFKDKMQNANATEITDGIKLKSGGKYKITNKSFASEVSLPKEAFTLYVGEGCKLVLANNDVQLDAADIYILQDASIETNADVIMKHNACIYNAGRVIVKDLSLEGSTLYNHSGSIMNPTNLILNGSTVYNHCLIKMKNEVSFDGAGSNIYLRPASSMDANNVKFEKENGASAIYMETKSFFHTNNFHKKSDDGLNIFGDPWYHMLSMKEQPVVQVNGNIKGSNIHMFRGVLLAANGWSDKIDFGQQAGVIDGDLPSDFQGSCYGTELVPDDRPIEGGASDPEGTIDPETEKTSPCVYMFEDNWPNIGDYDMNDVIINVGVVCDTKGSDATAAYLTGQVLAVGANKELYVFARILGTDKIVNLLGGAEIHQFMGKNIDEKINTSTKDCEPKDIGIIHVDVQGMKGLVNSNNLDVFIVWGDPNSNKRNEVHIPRFTGTGQAAKSDNSSANYKYKSNDENNNLMWGLMVPKGDFSYPKEGNPIMEAYPMFMDWVKAGGNVDVSQWYNSPIEEKVMR